MLMLVLIAVLELLSLLGPGLGGLSGGVDVRSTRAPFTITMSTPPSGAGLGGEGVPSMGDSMAGLDMLMNDPEGALLLERMQKSPQLMSAMMELALKGDDAMPEDDEVSSEIRDYLAKMKEIALRSSGGGAGREPPAK